MRVHLPLVSVVIPTYNRESLIEECLRSVLAQTYPHLEALVVDDGSRDGTRQIVSGLQRRDGRIRYLYQENAGVSAARNHGLREACGEFIALLDSDDVWHPWKLEVQVAALQALPDVGMIWTDMAAISEDGALLHDRFLRRMYGAYSRLGDRPLFQNSLTLSRPNLIRSPIVDGGPFRIQFGNIYSQMLYGNLVHTSTVLLRRLRAHQTGGFKLEYRHAGEDYAFHLETCRLGPVAFLDEASILYRIGGNDQITHHRNQIHFARAFLDTVRRELAQHSDQVLLSRQDVRRILSEAHAWLGSELRDHGRPGAAVVQLAQALWNAPGNRLAWHEAVRTAVPRELRRGIRRLLAMPAAATVADSAAPA